MTAHMTVHMMVHMTMREIRLQSYLSFVKKLKIELRFKISLQVKIKLSLITEVLERGRTRSRGLFRL